MSHRTPLRDARRHGASGRRRGRRCADGSRSTKGFSITVPSGWRLDDAPEQDASAAVVVGQKEVSAGVVGKLWVLVKDGGRRTDSLLSETRDNVVRARQGGTR
jgi:hypothetical protein